MATRVLGNLALLFVPATTVVKVGKAGEAIELEGDLSKALEGEKVALEAEKTTELEQSFAQAERESEQAQIAIEEAKRAKEAGKVAGETAATVDDRIITPNYVDLSKQLGKDLKKGGYKIRNIQDATDANARWADMGYDLHPVAENTKAYNVQAGKHTYARVFKEGVNNPKSPFMLKADSIEGLTASETAEKYALPQIPDKIVYPHIPSDTPLEVSITGPQKSWGTIGGDPQYAIKDVLLEDDWFLDIHSLN